MKKTVRKTKKKVKKPVDDVDEITRKLLDMEVSKTELEKFETFDYDSNKKEEKPKKSDAFKLTPIKIERKQIKPTKVVVVEPEQPQQIQLRKTKVIAKKQIEESKLPTVLLKSRIVRIEYPPQTHKLKITDLKAKKCQGELSRFEDDEPEKRKSKKIKKFKAPNEDRPELEEVDSFDFEETPEVVEVEDVKLKYERKPKQAPEPDEAEVKTIKLGKGKVPTEESPEDIVKLKKLPEKKETELVIEEQPKQKLIKEETEKEKPTKKKPKQKLEPLAPFEAPESEPYEKELYEKTPIDKPEPEEIEEKKPYQREPKPEKEHEEPVLNIVLGKPKPKVEPEEPEVKFRIPESKKPEEIIEPFKLKPWTKPDDEDSKQDEPKYDLTIKFEDQPQKDDELELGIDDSPEKPKQKKKIKKVKKPSEDDAELERLLNLDIEKTELETYEKIDVDLPKKAKTELEDVKILKPILEEIITEFKEPEAPEERETIESTTELKEAPKKKPPRPRKIIEEKPKEESLEIILQRKLKRRELTKETMEIVSQEPQHARTVEAQTTFEAELENIRRRLSKVDSNADSAESEASEASNKPEKKRVKKIKKKNTAEMDAELERLLNLEIEKTELEKYEKTDIELAKKEKAEIEQVIVPYKRLEKTPSEEEPDKEFVLKINRKARSETPEQQEMTFKRPKQLEKDEPENVSLELKKVAQRTDDDEKETLEEVTFGLKKKAEPAVVEDEEVVETIKKRRKPIVTEEVNIEASLKKPVEKKSDDVAEEATFGLRKKSEPVITEDVEIIETIKKKKKPKVSEEAEAEYSVKKPTKSKVMNEEAEATITQTVEEPEEEIVEEAPEEAVFGIRRPKPQPIISEEIEVAETIKKRKKPKVSEEAETEFSIKKQRKPKISSEEAEATVTKLIEKLDEEPIEEVIEIEEAPEEITEEFVFRRKSKPKVLQYEEHEDEFTVKKLKKPRKPSRPDFPEITEPENVTFRPKRTTHKEDVEQEFKIQLDSYAEEEISMSGKVKLKKPKPVYHEDSGEHRIRIIQEIDDEGPIIEEIIDDDSEPEDTMYDVDEPDEFSDKETLPEDLPEHVLIKLKRKKERRPYKIQDYEEESVSMGLPRKKHRKKVTSYDEDSLQLRLKRRSGPKYIEGKIKYFELRAINNLCEINHFINTTLTIYDFIKERSIFKHLISNTTLYYIIFIHLFAIKTLSLC